jgi:folate-dependent tRNA-U54 methylase TrmFO/GidA
MTHHTPVHVIGGGIAGTEAAWQIAQAGVPVVLHKIATQFATLVGGKATSTDLH